MTPLSTWRHEVTDIGEAGLMVERRADDKERAALAGALEIEACTALEARYEIRALGRGRYRMTGSLDARLTQACVVTLDPLPMRYEEDFEVEFWPQADLPDGARGESDVLSGSDPEPMEGGAIDAGRIVFECLSAVLDPFPRKDGAEFTGLGSSDSAAGDRDSPFAVLARLKGDRN